MKDRTIVEKPSSQITTLMKERTLLRKEGKYEEADKLRQAIESQGFILADEGEKTLLYHVQRSEKKIPHIALFGTGGITTPERKVHEYLFKKIGSENVRICLITTPAGFEPNVKAVYEEIADFFTKSLKNFHPSIKIVCANTKEDVNNPKIVEEIKGHDYIFTGPGSPTYALRILKGSLLYEEIQREVMDNQTSLGLASAATLAFSHFTLPVYEIFKVGSPLYWESGLNFFQSVYKPITIIPHFNNKNGGIKNDTSFNFMGKERFEKLQKLLPPEEEIWGIDESTGIVIDLYSKKHTIFGSGDLHIIKNPAPIKERD